MHWQKLKVTRSITSITVHPDIEPTLLNNEGPLKVMTCMTQTDILFD